MANVSIATMQINKSTRMRSGEDLLFTDTAGETFTADDLGKRNEAFAQVGRYAAVTTIADRALVDRGIQWHRLAGHWLINME